MTKKDFIYIVDHIYPQRNSLVIKDQEGKNKFILFDYPNYGGIKKSLADKLSPEAVDAMQAILHLNFKTKRDFSKAYKQKLNVLGEKIGR